MITPVVPRITYPKAKFRGQELHAWGNQGYIRTGSGTYKDSLSPLCTQNGEESSGVGVPGHTESMVMARKRKIKEFTGLYAKPALASVSRLPVTVPRPSVANAYAIKPTVALHLNNSLQRGEHMEGSKARLTRW